VLGAVGCIQEEAQRKNHLITGRNIKPRGEGGARAEKAKCESEVQDDQCRSRKRAVRNKKFESLKQSQNEAGAVGPSWQLEGKPKKKKNQKGKPTSS